MTAMERLTVLAVHAAAHFSLYTLPRGLFVVCVYLPRTVWRLLLPRQAHGRGFGNARDITVLTTSKNAAAAERLLGMFGLSTPMRYTGPMYSGHIHTVLGGQRVSRRVPYDRELLDAEDGNLICLDWLKVPAGQRECAKGILLVIPGLGNYSQTPYQQRLAMAAVRRGYHYCCLTPRGMGSAPLTVPRLTCATFTADLTTALHHRFQGEALRRDFGWPMPVFVVGFSVGGNTVLKGLAEEERAQRASGGTRYTDGFPVSACFCINSPYDIASFSAALQTKVGLWVYQGAMMSALRKYYIKHAKVIGRGLPGLPPMSADETTKFIYSLKTVQDFDSHVVAPHFGYASAAEYYADGSAFKWLRKLKTVPVVCVAARDDPMAGVGVKRSDWQAICDERSNLVYVETPTGGHLGYLGGPLDEYKGCDTFISRFPIDLADHFLRYQAGEK